MILRLMKAPIISLALLLSTYAAFSQGSVKKDRFNYILSKATGDLNKDQIPDFAIVTQDTLADTAPYRIQVFFGKPGGGRTLVVSSTKAIAEQHPGGKNGYRDGYGFSEIEIAKNVLTISCELLRGGNEAKFRYQNGNFELIGFSESFSDGQGHIHSVDFNLSTNVIVHEKENYETGKMVESTKKILKIRPLPKLQNYIPGELLN